jgi:hypothetical protein
MDGFFVLADISGYTAFLQSVNEAHGAEMAAAPEVPAAYPMMTSLLDGIVERLVPPFTLSKFEGDAVFAYAPQASLPLRGQPALDCLVGCYASFRERRDRTDNLMLCNCSACSRLNDLELKFVVHQGSYVLQSIAGHEELLGPDVTMAHLLLKNSVVDAFGRSAYALVTEPAVTHLEIPLGDSHPHTEHYAHYSPIRSHVFAL